MRKESRDGKIKKVFEKRQEGIIVLEDVHDAHNVQAVARTAEGLGFQRIGLIFEKEKYFDAKRVGGKSSSSANKWLEYRVFRSSKEAFESLKKEGYEIVVSVLDKEAKSLYKEKFLDRKIALVLGNEHRGVSEEAIKAADRKIYIEMKGMVQSFNISVAGAIMMYEIDRQREKAGREKFELEKEERNELYEKYRWNK